MATYKSLAKRGKTKGLGNTIFCDEVHKHIAKKEATVTTKSKHVVAFKWTISNLTIKIQQYKNQNETKNLRYNKKITSNTV